MPVPPAVVSRDEWLVARKALLEREKELTHLKDVIAAERRKLPWVKVDKTYRFETDRGAQNLADLFEGRSQLIVYHFMYGPEWESPCPSCCLMVDHLGGPLPHLNARDISLAVVSRAPLQKLSAMKQRMGWKFRWVSSGQTDFNYDMQVSFKPEDIRRGEVEYNYMKTPTPAEDLPGFSVFAKDDAGQVYHTYSSFARGCDLLLGTYNYIDMTPKGRDEEGLNFGMAWVRLHDEYGPGYKVDPLANYAPPKGSCCHPAGAKV
ncbi:MAG TPA: thioredoxin family protein [Caulifigura sp.]|jgi:predicted dithiol-disulfide oxidoreductase (DUF899 family)|nr:thioredoxin family protein [Caulifigura sp.]